MQKEVRKSELRSGGGMGGVLLPTENVGHGDSNEGLPTSVHSRSLSLASL